MVTVAIGVPATFLGTMLITTVPAQTGPPASPSNSSCPPFISNYTSGVADLSIFTSFLQTYEDVGLDTDPSSGFSLFAPTDRAWNRIEQTLSTHAMSCMLSCEHAASACCPASMP